MKWWQAILCGMSSVMDIGGSGYRVYEPMELPGLEDDTVALRGDWERASQKCENNEEAPDG